MRYCRQVLYSPRYVSKQMLEQSLKNSFDHVEMTYLMVGTTSWNYGTQVDQNIDMEYLDMISEKYNCMLCINSWDKEESMRNSAIAYAQRDGFNFMFIQDADEFLSPESFNVIKGVTDYDYALAPWKAYWKRWGHVLQNQASQEDIGFPQFVINLASNIKFKDKRSLEDGYRRHTYNANQMMIHHGSYVLTDRQVQEKIYNWGHSGDFDTKRWYEEKWLNGSTNLHPVNPSAWLKCSDIGVDSLPLEIQNWDYNRMEDTNEL